MDNRKLKKKNWSKTPAFGNTIGLGLIVATIVCVGILFPRNGNAEEPKLNCTPVNVAAQHIMSYRQDGKTIEEMKALAFGLDSVMPMIEDAWKEPIQPTEAGKDEVVRHFGDEQQKRCG